MTKSKTRKVRVKSDNTNSTVENRENRLWLRCSYCPPNRGENATRKAKHGTKKPKYKDKRK